MTGSRVPSAAADRTGPKLCAVDYGRPVEFGYFLVPDASDPQKTLRSGRLADELGLDLVGVQDHPYQSRHLDTWTLLAAIAAQTRRVRVFPDVANLPLRPPAVLAKAAASLDLLSGGRVELGLGAGSFWQGITAMDGRQRTPGASVDALEQAIQVIRLMWSGERSAWLRGRHYSLSGVHPGPQPAHPIGIWLGAYKPRMLELTGRLADGCIPSLGYLKLGDLPQMNQRIDQAAERAGRQPEAVRRLLNVGGVFTSGANEGPLRGPTAQWVEELAQLALEHGIDGFVLSAQSEDELRRFALEVAPAVREKVAQYRRNYPR
jgi:alkanesulfonate monooxygenase SsuD/methylene tetrahydromethanopterin reductase-like flavin-dependent oxidoreductase (luciferase family)